MTIALVGRASDLNGNNQAEPLPCVPAAAASVATFKVAEGVNTGICESRV